MNVFGCVVLFFFFDRMIIIWWAEWCCKYNIQFELLFAVFFFCISIAGEI